MLPTNIHLLNSAPGASWQAFQRLLQQFLKEPFQMPLTLMQVDGKVLRGHRGAILHNTRTGLQYILRFLLLHLQHFATWCDDDRKSNYALLQEHLGILEPAHLYAVV